MTSSATTDIHGAVDPSDPPSRFIGVYFTHWHADLEMALLRRTLRLAQAGMDALPHPLLVVQERHRVHEVIGCCPLASSTGVRVGMTLSQAEASIDHAAVLARVGDASAQFVAAINALREGGSTARLHRGPQALGGAAWVRRIVALDARLMAIQWDADLGARALERLGRCLERWIPVVSTAVSTAASITAPSGHSANPAAAAPGIGLDGAFLLGDFTGCAELFRSRYGTEQRFMRRVGAGFGQHGFRVRLATASTIGAAVAMAGWGDGRGVRAIPRGAERAMLGPLPIESLRISAAAAEALRSVEVETVEQLACLGRTGVAARLSGAVDRQDHGDATHAPASRTRTRRGSAHATGRSGHVASIAWGAIAPQHQAPAPRSNLRRRGCSARSGSSAEPSLFDGPRTEACNGKRASHPRLRAVDDVLVRLDQSLGGAFGSSTDAGPMVAGPMVAGPTVAGVAPEVLLPMRAHEPVVEETHFDGPCAQLETVIVAVSALVDRIVHRLHARREGLRSAHICLRHADLPADLSTDRPIRVSPPEAPGQSPHGGSSEPSRDMIRPGARPETHIELSVARPTLSRAHLWSVLRPRLEAIALDHGVESIQCTVERSVRLRYRELASVLPGAMAAGATPASPCGTDWIDLLKGRLGGSAVIELPLGGVEMGGEMGDEMDGVAWSGLATHRPPVILAHPEPAVVRGGASARHLAAAVATRTLWRSVEDRRIRHAFRGEDSSGTLHPATHRSAEPPSCEWRGVRWELHSIDGWERIAHPWWSSRLRRRGGHSHASAATDMHSEDAGHASSLLGQMHARIEVGDGLWLFVRWPSHLSRADPPSMRAAEAPSCLDPFARWLDGGAASIERGVTLEVLGVWG